MQQLGLRFVWSYDLSDYEYLAIFIRTSVMEE